MNRILRLSLCVILIGVGGFACAQNGTGVKPERLPPSVGKPWAIMPPEVKLGNLLEPGQRTADMSRDACAALMYINHLNHVIAKLGNFNDLLLLQQEYEGLTDNHLNLETIKDEATVQVIMQLLDAISGLEKENLKGFYAKAALEKAKKNAIWEALPGPNIIFMSKGNPYMMAAVVGCATLTSVMNYYKAKAQAEADYENKKLDIATEKLSYINELNKELFFSQWRLIQKYNLRDSMRITREENELFLGFAKVLELKGSMAKTSSNSKLVWEIFKNNEQEMGNLPFYWVTRAVAAETIAEKVDVIYSCERYFSLFVMAPIIRKDTTACSMALLYISHLERPKAKEEKESCKAWLDFIEKTARIPEWQIKFSLAERYGTLLDDREKALEIIRKTFLEVHACMKVWETSRQNLFYSTPSFQRALKVSGDEEKTLDGMTEDDLAKLNDTAPRLLPTAGWYWLKDAWLALLLETKANQEALKEWKDMTECSKTETTDPIDAALCTISDPQNGKQYVVFHGLDGKIEGDAFRVTSKMKGQWIGKVLYQPKGDGKPFKLIPKDENANVYVKPKTGEALPLGPATLTVTTVDTLDTVKNTEPSMKGHASVGFCFQYVLDVDDAKHLTLRKVTMYSPWRGEKGVTIFEGP